MDYRPHFTSLHYCLDPRLWGKSRAGNACGLLSQLFLLLKQASQVYLSSVFVQCDCLLSSDADCVHPKCLRAEDHWFGCLACVAEDLLF